MGHVQVHIHVQMQMQMRMRMRSPIFYIFLSYILSNR